MFDTKFFDDLANKLSNAIPNSIRDTAKDLEKNFKAILQSTFSKQLHLVTREEFDMQTHVLLRTRVKLDELEKQVEELEKHLKVSSHSKKTTSAKKTSQDK